MSLNRPTPLFVLVMTIIILMIITVTIVFTAHEHAMQRQEEQMLKWSRSQGAYQYRKLDCPEGVDLWDCMTFAYLEDDSGKSQKRPSD